MLEAAERAKSLAETYLDPVQFDDGSKVRFSMLVALLEGIASLKLWPKRYPSMGDEDRFGWGVDDADRLREALDQVASGHELLEPWVIHARYIHSVVDTAVRLELRYGRKPGTPIVGIIIGDTPNSKRDEIKDRFSRGDLNILCMSDAGAEGINLQRSNRIVLLDVPVSPGRIEQITGRVHRLGSARAAQVTLLLPPEYFGTRVFEALRKAASNVFKQAAGSKIPSPPASGAEDDPYYVRELADYEARLLTAVAEASGAIRGEENRGALEQVVSQPELPNKEPNTEPIESVLKTGFDLIEEQRQRFQDEKVATLSDFMPEIGDLVDALVKFEGAKTEPASDNFHVPIGLIEDRAKPEEYGDLVTRKEPFHVLQVNKQNFWYGPQRFLPSDVPRKEGFQWLGVVGNRLISELLRGWRQEKATLTDEQRFEPQIWISNGVPKGKVLAFCGIANEYKADGMAAASSGERSLHVLLGFADYAAEPAVFHWRPFYAKGASVPRARRKQGHLVG